MARNKKRFDDWAYNDNNRRLVELENERLRMEMQRQQNSQMIQYNGYGGGGYSPIGAAITTGSLTWSQPIVMDVVGQSQYTTPMSIPVPPGVYELPVAKEDPLAWLDRRVDEICKVGAIK